LLLVVFAGCRGPAAAGGARREVRDGTGVVVTLAVTVTRVISLAPSSTEIVYALGAGDRLVGVDRYSDWPPEARAVARVGADIDPSLERIVALKPDLVLTATTANSPRTADALKNLGIPVYVSRASRLEEVYLDVEGIGQALGRAETGRALASSLKARIAAVRATMAGVAPVLSAVVVWTDPLVLAGPGSHVADLLAAAGGRNAADDVAQPFPTYSLERLVKRAPEVIVVGSHADGRPTLQPLERLATLPAVQHRRVYRIDGDLLFRPGPRVVEGAERLARLLHPDVDGGAP
jgi:iron complex transport system substrate-binding protein